MQAADPKPSDVQAKQQAEPFPSNKARYQQPKLEQHGVWATLTQQGSVGIGPGSAHFDPTGLAQFGEET
jgi:hypothetical protein